MKIVDLDWIEKDSQIIPVNHWILDSCTILRNSEDKKAVPNEAIYYFSSKEDCEYICKNKGILFLGNPWKGTSIKNMLIEMIDKISRFKTENKMNPISKFEGRVPVQVLTTRELGDIENLGAIPVLPIFLGAI